jgi:hypothetical protein
MDQEMSTTYDFTRHDWSTQDINRATEVCSRAEAILDIANAGEGKFEDNELQLLLNRMRFDLEEVHRILVWAEQDEPEFIKVLTRRYERTYSRWLALFTSGRSSNGEG